MTSNDFQKTLENIMKWFLNLKVFQICWRAQNILMSNQVPKQI